MAAITRSDVAALAHAMRPLVYRLYDVLRRHSPSVVVTHTQGSVLHVLVHDGPQRISRLAVREGVRLPTMSNVIDRLERDGYVTREPDPEDGRAVVVRPTEKARADLEVVVAAREAFLSERLRQLSPADRDAIERALPALGRLIDAEPRTEPRASSPTSARRGGADSGGDREP